MNRLNALIYDLTPDRKKRKLKSKNMKSDCEGLDFFLNSMGYELVDKIDLGMHPEDRSFDSVILCKIIKDGGLDDTYAVWVLKDWSYHPDRKMSKRPYDIREGRLRLTHFQGRELMDQYVRSLQDEVLWAPLYTVG